MLDLLDHLATIATAIVAAAAYVEWQWRRREKIKRLECYLQNERPGKRSAGDKGRRTVLHLMAALGLTEADILDAAFSSKHITRTTSQDPVTKRADCLFLEYSS